MNQKRAKMRKQNKTNDELIKSKNGHRIHEISLISTNGLFQYYL